jgi:hypothetical protein
VKNVYFKLKTAKLVLLTELTHQYVIVSLDFMRTKLIRLANNAHGNVPNAQAQQIIVIHALVIVFQKNVIAQRIHLKTQQRQ